MKRECLECGQAVAGRTDKKFCDDQCRSNYNNRRKAENTTVVKTINQVLIKNRKILLNLNKEGKTRISRAKMLREGFNFQYFTHILETQKGSVYKFCYEEGYISISEDWCLLVRSKEENKAHSRPDPSI